MFRGATAGEALTQARLALAACSETASLDAQVILAEALGVGRTWPLTHPEAPLPEAAARKLEDFLARLRQGEPLPYLLGAWEFYGRRFRVTPDVLIPRPETELLVEAAVESLRAHPDWRRVLDVGTGSGCVAITLALECSGVSVIGSDLSLSALGVASENSRAFGVDSRVSLVQADLLTPLATLPELVCANLPYVSRSELPSASKPGREPRLALDGGEGGMQVLRRMLGQIGLLGGVRCALLEIGDGQGRALRSLTEASCPGADLQVRQDLAGKDRLAVLNFPVGK